MSGFGETRNEIILMFHVPEKSECNPNLRKIFIYPGEEKLGFGELEF